MSEAAISSTVETVPDDDLMQALVLAICNAGKYHPRCTWPECAHLHARARAMAAFRVMEGVYRNERHG